MRPTKPTKPKASFKLDLKRLRAVKIAVIAALVACGLQLINLQIIRGPALAEEAQSKRTDIFTIQAQRGRIFDAGGEILAESVERYTVVANNREVAKYRHVEKTRNAQGKTEIKVLGTGPVEAAKQLAPILDMDPAELGGKLVADKLYVLLARKVTPDVWRKIKDLKIRGIESQLEYERSYPHNDTAGQLVGFLNEKGQGVAGVESSENKQLTGTPGKGAIEVARFGQLIPTGLHEVTPAKRGKDIHLTINSDLQHSAETALNAAVASANADWGTVVVQEVTTGRILVLADSGAINPNDRSSFKGKVLGSRAVEYSYEPGSTGKLITFAAALEQGAITPTTPIVTPYQWTSPSGQTFRDSHAHPTITMTAAGVLAESSNTGTVQIGDKISDQSRYELMRNFGLNQRTGIGLPNETRAGVAAPQKWDGRQRYTTMFGQGMAVSPVQVTSMIATIANKGVRLQPHIIDGWSDPAGPIEKAKLAAPVRVIDEKTAQTLITMMEAVTGEEGTARKAEVAGYRTAGKTGTTQIIGANGKVTGNVASFVGLAPAEAPRIAVSVVIYRPRTSIYGGAIAAPVFSQVVTDALRSMSVRPSTQPAELYPLKAQ